MLKKIKNKKNGGKFIIKHGIKIKMMSTKLAKKKKNVKT